MQLSAFTGSRSPPNRTALYTTAAAQNARLRKINIIICKHYISYSSKSQSEQPKNTHFFPRQTAGGLSRRGGIFFTDSAAECFRRYIFALSPCSPRPTWYSCSRNIPKSSRIRQTAAGGRALHDSVPFRNPSRRPSRQ